MQAPGRTGGTVMWVHGLGWLLLFMMIAIPLVIIRTYDD